MRNTAMQYQNRMRKLADLTTEVCLKRMRVLADIRDQQATLKVLEEESNNLWERLVLLEGTERTLVRRMVEGLYEWGLPEAIPRQQWLEVTGEDLSAGGNP